MKENNLTKLGGSCAILVGISYILVGVAIFVDPVLKLSNNAERWMAFLQNPTAHLILRWSLAMGGALALATIPAVSKLFDSVDESEGWVRWTSNLAYIGFAVTSLENFRALGLLNSWSKLFTTGDATTKTAIEVSSAAMALDPEGWFAFGGVGLWILVISLLARKKSMWPNGLAYIGIAVAILYWLTIVAGVFDIEQLLFISAGIGSIVLAPIWYIWVGLILRKTGSYQTEGLAHERLKLRT